MNNGNRRVQFRYTIDRHFDGADGIKVCSGATIRSERVETNEQIFWSSLRRNIDSRRREVHSGGINAHYDRSARIIPPCCKLESRIRICVIESYTSESSSVEVCTIANGIVNTIVLEPSRPKYIQSRRESQCAYSRNNCQFQVLRSTGEDSPNIAFSTHNFWRENRAIGSRCSGIRGNRLSRRVKRIDHLHCGTGAIGICNSDQRWSGRWIETSDWQLTNEIITRRQCIRRECSTRIYTCKRIKACRCIRHGRPEKRICARVEYTVSICISEQLHCRARNNRIRSRLEGIVSVGVHKRCTCNDS